MKVSHTLRSATRPQQKINTKIKTKAKIHESENNDALN